MTQYTYEDEIELRDLIMVIWQGRWWIIFAVLVSAAAASVYATFVRDPVYEATVSFLAPDYQLADGKTLRQADYLPLFLNESISEELVYEYDLASPPDIDRAVSEFLTSIEVKPQANSSVVVVSLRHGDRTTALNMLGDYVRLVQSRVKSFAAGINGDYLGRVEGAFQAHASEYRKALDDLKQFEMTSDLSGLRESLQGRQARLSATEQRIDSLKSTTDSLRSTLEETQRQIAETQPLILVKDILDAASVSFLVQRGFSDVGQTGMLAVEREQVNPVYNSLLDLMYSSRRQLISSEAELKAIENHLPALSEEIESLGQLVAEAEERYAVLSTTVDQTKARYDKAASLRSTALSTVDSTGYGIIVVNDPWASTSLVGPGTMRIVALAVVLAEVVSVFGVLFADYMRSSSRRAAIQPPTSTVAQ